MIVNLKNTFNARFAKEVCGAYELSRYDQQLVYSNKLYIPNRLLFVDSDGGIQRENIVKICNVPQ